MNHSKIAATTIWSLISFLALFSSGCVATQDWIKTYVPEHLFAVNKRVSDTETNVTQLGGQVQTMPKQIADLDSRLNQTTAKADRALEDLQRLKLDRKLVLDLRQGASFSSNSTVLTDQAKKEIDSFLSDLSGDAGGMSGLMLLVAGPHQHTRRSEKKHEVAIATAPAGA